MKKKMLLGVMTLFLMILSSCGTQNSVDAFLDSKITESGLGEQRKSNVNGVYYYDSKYLGEECNIGITHDGEDKIRSIGIKIPVEDSDEFDVILQKIIDDISTRYGELHISSQNTKINSTHYKNENENVHITVNTYPNGTDDMNTPFITIGIY